MAKERATRRVDGVMAQYTVLRSQRMRSRGTMNPNKKNQVFVRYIAQYMTARKNGRITKG